MDSEKEKKLLIALIKDDLIGSKLVGGLNRMGLEAQNYYQHLSETIFDAMGFQDNEQDEEVYYQYIALTKKALDIDISNGNHTLNDLVEEIYEFLSKNAKD